LSYIIVSVNIDAAASAASATRHTLEAKKLLKHPLYSATTFDNDIALIYLPVNAVKSAMVAIGYTPMQDPSDTAVFAAYFYNNQARTFGWGRTGQTAAYSSTLQTAQGPIITLADCQSTYPTVTANQICTAQRNWLSREVRVCFI
jgi:hypothetical protein